MFNKNLFKMEFARYRNSMLIWSLVICWLIILDMALYQVFLKEGMIAKMSPLVNSDFFAPMMKGFGVEINKLSNILGFYVIRNTPLIILLAGMFSILSSVSIFANEEFEKTAEFLYTRPLTRSEIFISKVLAVFTHIFIINIIVVIIGFASLEIFKTEEYSRQAFLIHSIYGILCSVTFAAVGFTLAVLAKRGRGLLAMSVGIVLGTYFLDLIAKVSPTTAYIGYVSPFSYVDTNILVENYSLNGGYTAFFLITSAVLIFISYRIFLKKDILN